MTEDIPDNSVVVAEKPRVIHKDAPLDNRFVSWRNGREMYWDNGVWKNLE